jgi:hypothetical protein
MPASILKAVLLGTAAAGPTVGFEFRNFENYRICALLYADRPNWLVLGSIVVR